MLDMTSTSTPIPAWQTSLQRGDVVLFRFPHAEDGATEEPKSRTCLILEIETRGGKHFATVAYGTSATTRANVGDDIHVSLPDAMAAAGVRKPTRFVCARRITVALDHQGWDINPAHSSPVVGQLAPGELAQMNAIHARIHALRDMAIERLATRRGGFTVEHRRRRSTIQPGKAVRG